MKRCIAEAGGPVKTVLIDAEAMNDIDIAGADRLITLNTELNSKNIVMFVSWINFRDNVVLREILVLVIPCVLARG